METPDWKTVRMMVEVQELMDESDKYVPRVEQVSVEARIEEER